MITDIFTSAVESIVSRNPRYRWAADLVIGYFQANDTLCLAEGLRSLGITDTPEDLYRVWDAAAILALLGSREVLDVQWALRNPATGLLCIERFNEVEDMPDGVVVHEEDGTPFDGASADVVPIYSVSGQGNVVAIDQDQLQCEMIVDRLSEIVKTEFLGGIRP